jgi:transcriptional regulator with XRE-family HTH domain
MTARRIDDEAREIIKRLPDNWIPADTFGARLVRLRKHVHMTIEEIADHCDLSTATWSSWERGASPLKIGAACDKISAATKCDRDWLQFGDLDSGARTIHR